MLAPGTIPLPFRLSVQVQYFVLAYVSFLLLVFMFFCLLVTSIFFVFFQGMAVGSDTYGTFEPARATPTAGCMSASSVPGMDSHPSAVRPQDGNLPSTNPSASSTAGQCTCSLSLPCIF